ncbi:hypothetical protein KO481_09755 [Nocardia sp. NEAU-G5]|uniref:Uncharacterized protein n=1 Tax=Nocardia albiluteola TaxID=2842303 RepID=A0ABS6AUV7_9NOCA|nr:hypothetical protein [Nocardia albiluteola]
MKSMESRMRGNSHVRFGGRPQETESRQLDHRACGRPNRPPDDAPDPIGYALGLAAALDAAAIVVFDLAAVDDRPARVCEAFDLETVCPATTWARVFTSPDPNRVVPEGNRS